MKRGSGPRDQSIDEVPLNEDLVLTHTTNDVSTSVPHVVILHSPTGYEWGYMRSGLADLALNVLSRVSTVVSIIQKEVYRINTLLGGRLSISKIGF